MRRGLLLCLVVLLVLALGCSTAALAAPPVTYDVVAVTASAPMPTTDMSLIRGSPPVATIVATYIQHIYANVRGPGWSPADKQWGYLPIQTDSVSVATSPLYYMTHYCAHNCGDYYLNAIPGARSDEIKFYGDMPTASATTV